MRKTSKLLILVAILVMAVGLGALVGAESATPNLNIEYVNVSFSDNIWLKYAVPYDETNTIKLLIWETPQSEYLYGTHSYELEYEEIQKINGADYLVFNFKKQAAKQMYDYVYARAYTNQGGEKVYGNLNKYNVVEYAYKVLGKTSAGINDNKARALASAVLEYGATAQTYLNYKTDTLANADFYQVKLDGGALVLDSCNHGLYLAGTEVEITAPATNETGDEFTCWTDSLGTVVATTADATITVGAANDIYTANYGNTTPVVTTYTVKFVDWDGTILKEQVVNEGEDATPPADPSREGYTFDGWEGDYTNVNTNVTITAKYTKDAEELYTVTFYDYDGTTVLKTEEVNPGGDATPPEDPTKAGATFIGWSSSYVNVYENIDTIAVFSDSKNIFALEGEAEDGSVIVTLSLKGTVSLCRFFATLKYDPEVLKLTGYDAELSLYAPVVNPEKDDDGNIVGDPNGVINLSWATSSNKTRKADIIELYFDVVDATKAAAAVDVVVNGIKQISNSEQVDVEYAVTCCVIPLQ